MKYDYFVINYSDGSKQVAGVYKISRFTNLKSFFDNVKTITNENGESAVCNVIHHADSKQSAIDTATAWNNAYKKDYNLFEYYEPFYNFK